MPYFQTEASFWAKVQKGTDDECWEWMRRKDKKGYGLARFMALTGKESSIPAHRIAFALAKNGGILPPEGIVVHHRCENKGCVNPNHLELIEHGLHTSLHKTGTGLGCAKHGYAEWSYKWRECRICKREKVRLRDGFSPRVPGCRKHGKKDWRESDSHCRICDRSRIRKPKTE